MDATDLPLPVAGRSVKRRIGQKVVGDDHVPAMLAPSDTVPEPAIVATPQTAPAPMAFEGVAPVPAAPPVAAPADYREDMMDTLQTPAAEHAVDPREMFTDLTNCAKSAIEKGQQMFEDLNSFTKGNLEAMVQSSRIAAKGFETLGQEAAELTRRHVEGATQAAKTLSQTKSPTEFMKLQSDYARSMFDTMVAETSRSTERMIKLANDIAQPISNRVAVATEKMKLAA